jgi:type VI protein secretion system component VasK
MSLKVLKLKIILVSVLIIVALISVPIISSSGHVKFKHALEWDFMIGVLSFYMLTFFFWKKPQSHTLSGM